jgi:hypothetical protein
VFSLNQRANGSKQKSFAAYKPEMNPYAATALAVIGAR